MNREQLQTQELERHCVMRRGPLWFAVQALAVREVCPRPNVVSVPGSDPSLVGLCHHRNEFIPVLSLDRLLGNDRGDQQDGDQMLVVNTNNVAWSLLVDAVTALEPLQISINAEGRADDTWSRGIIGSATCGDRIVQVLNATSLYRLAERVLCTAWNQDQLQASAQAVVRTS